MAKVNVGAPEYVECIMPAIWIFVLPFPPYPLEGTCERLKPYLSICQVSSHFTVSCLLPSSVTDQLTLLTAEFRGNLIIDILKFLNVRILGFGKPSQKVLKITAHILKSFFLETWKLLC